MSFAPVFPGLCLDLVRSSRRHAFHGAFLAAAVLSLSGFSLGTARAQTPGSLDTNFAPSVTNLTVFTLGFQLDDLGTEQIIAGGDNRLLARFPLNGTSPVGDTAFLFPPRVGGINFTTYTLAFEDTMPGTEIGTTGSRILIAGLFGRATTSDAVGQNITAINNDGSLDLLFNPGGLGANGEVTALLPLRDAAGTLVIGGGFTSYNDELHNHIVRLTSIGTVDKTYTTSLSASDVVFGLAQQIDPATGLPNGQVLVAGSFNRINKTEPAKLARLNVDGSLDTTFNPDFGTRTFTIVVQADGKILVGGSFDTVNGAAANNIVRLNQDGTTDTTFVGSITGNVNVINTPPTAVNVIALNPDGRIYVGGNFTTADGVKRQNIARLEADGTLDASFDAGAVIANRTQYIAVQSDNNVLVGITRITTPSTTSTFPNDLVRLFGGPLLPPTVSIGATVSKARKGDSNKSGRANGQIEIVRSQPLAQALPVTFSTSNTAVLGSDYRLYNDADPSQGGTNAITTGTITIPAGADRVLIDVVPKRKSSPGVPKVKATLDLTATGVYNVGASASATVKIRPPLSE